MTHHRRHRLTRLQRITKDSELRRFTPPPAMIYQHATTVEDRTIADRLSGLVDAHRAESDDPDGADFPAGMTMIQMITGTCFLRGVFLPFHRPGRDRSQRAAAQI